MNIYTNKEILYMKVIKIYSRDNKLKNNCNINIPSEIQKRRNLKKGNYVGFSITDKHIYIYFDLNNPEIKFIRKLASKGKGFLSINIPKEITCNKNIKKNTDILLYEFKDKIILKQLKKS